MSKDDYDKQECSACTAELNYFGKNYNSISGGKSEVSLQPKKEALVMTQDEAVEETRKLVGENATVEFMSKLDNGWLLVKVLTEIHDHLGTGSSMYIFDSENGKLLRIEAGR